MNIGPNCNLTFINVENCIGIEERKLSFDKLIETHISIVETLQICQIIDENQLRSIEIKQLQVFFEKIANSPENFEQIRESKKSICFETLFQSAVLDFNPAHFCYFLKRYEFFKKIFDNSNLSIVEFIDNLNLLTLDQLKRLKKNRFVIIKLMNTNNFSFKEVIDFFLIDLSKMNLIYPLHSQFKKIFLEEIIPIKELLSCEPHRLFYFLTKYEEIKSHLTSDKSLWGKLRKLNYSELIKFQPLVFANLSPWITLIQDRKFFDYNIKDIMGLKKIVFHLCCSSLSSTHPDAQFLLNYRLNSRSLEGIYPGYLFIMVIKILKKIEKNPFLDYSDQKRDTIKKLINRIAQSLFYEFIRKYSQQIKAPILQDLLVIYWSEQIINYDNSDLGILISGGWQGHTITYVIKKNFNEKYSFYICNRGNGLQQHPTKTIGKKKLFQTSLYWNNLESCQLTDPIFIKKLFNLKNRNYSSKENIYTFLNDYFAKEPVRSESITDFYSEQMRGTCAWKNLWLSCKEIVGNELFMRKLKVDMTRELYNVSRLNFDRNEKISNILLSIIRETISRRDLNIIYFRNQFTFQNYQDPESLSPESRKRSREIFTSTEIDAKKQKIF